MCVFADSITTYVPKQLYSDGEWEVVCLDDAQLTHLLCRRQNWCLTQVCLDVAVNQHQICSSYCQ